MLLSHRANSSLARAASSVKAIIPLFDVFQTTRIAAGGGDLIVICGQSKFEYKKSSAGVDPVQFVAERIY